MLALQHVSRKKQDVRHVERQGVAKGDSAGMLSGIVAVAKIFGWPVNQNRKAQRHVIGHGDAMADHASPLKSLMWSRGTCRPGSRKQALLIGPTRISPAKNVRSALVVWRLAGQRSGRPAPEIERRHGSGRNESTKINSSYDNDVEME